MSSTPRSPARAALRVHGSLRSTGDHGSMHAPTVPARSFAHPAWWLALALLVANDHLFKGAGVLPPWLTGKLSDFAGMLVAPAVLAALLRTRTRRGFAAAHLAIGGWFAAVNLVPAAARAWEGLFAATPFPWRITVDPTDLVALPALALGFALYAAWCERPAPIATALARLGLATGSLACIATSPPPAGPYIEPPPGTFFPSVSGRLALVNYADFAQVVRVRPLKATVQADCPAIERDPSLLSRDLFEPASTWLLEGGRVLPLGDGFTPCGLLLVDGPELPLRLITTRAHPQTTFPSEATQVPEALAIGLHAEDEGMAWGSHPALLPAPLDQVADGCGPVPEGFGVSWSLPPIGEGVLLARTRAPDGCEAFDLIMNSQPIRWFACFPELDLPFGPEEPIRIVPLATGADWQRVDGVQVVGARGRLVLTRGADLPDVGLSAVTATADTECTAGLRDACGSFSQALSVSFEVEGERVVAPIGEVVRVGSADLIVARAAQALVVDTACSAVGAGTADLEAAAVEWIAE